MATSLNVVKRERKKGFVRVKQALRSLDTQVEVAQRFVQRKINLKASIIEAIDLGKLITLLKNIDAALRVAINVLEAIKGVF